MLHISTSPSPPPSRTEADAVMGMLRLAGAPRKDKSSIMNACHYNPVLEFCRERSFKRPDKETEPENHCIVTLAQIRFGNDFLYPAGVGMHEAHEWRHFVCLSNQLSRGAFVVIWYREECMDDRYMSPLCRRHNLKCFDGAPVLGSVIAVVVSPFMTTVERNAHKVFQHDLRCVQHIPSIMMHVPTAMEISTREALNWAHL